MMQFGLMEEMSVVRAVVWKKMKTNSITLVTEVMVVEVLMTRSYQGHRAGTCHFPSSDAGWLLEGLMMVMSAVVAVVEVRMKGISKTIVLMVEMMILTMAMIGGGNSCGQDDKGDYSIRL